MQVVTVPGGAGVTIAIPYTSGDNAAIATQLLSSLYYANPQSINVVQAAVDPGAPGIAGDVNEFGDNLAGQVAVPSGYQYLVGGYYTSAQAQYPSDSFLAVGVLDGAILDNQSTSFSYRAGTGTVTVVAGCYVSALTITTLASGGGNGVLYLDGSGTETVSLASGNWSVSTGFGAGTFSFGSGTDAITVQGADTVVGGSGTGTVTLQQSHDVFDGGNGTATVVDNGTGDSVVGGAGADTVFALGNGLHIVGGAGQMELVDLDGGSNLTATNGGVVIFAGTHGSVFTAGSSYFIYINGGGDDTVRAPSSAAGPVIFGANNCDVHVDVATAGTYIAAGNGDETIDASQSTDGVTFFANSGNDVFIGAAHSANFYCAEPANSTMSGGIGNIYEFIEGHGGYTNTITDFTPYDGLYLYEFGTSANAGIANETVVNGVLNMTLTDGTKIIFENLSSASQLNGQIHHI